MIKPYLKYVGSKQQLAGQILSRFPAQEEWDVYCEPFCGSCAIFFHLFGTESIFDSREGKTAVLTDANEILINSHRSITYNLNLLRPKLLDLQDAHNASLDHNVFYKLQAARMNEIMGANPKAISHDGFYGTPENLEAAALYIYLNKTAFNGLWRINRSGRFNATWNKETKINLITPQLEACSDLFHTYARFRYADFFDTIGETIRDYNDKRILFFIDPPYVPLSKGENFAKYTGQWWTELDTNMLSQMLKVITNRGHKFMMTNSSNPLVYEFFGDWNITEVTATRMIRPKADRPTVKETIITNY